LYPAHIHLLINPASLFGNAAGTALIALALIRKRADLEPIGLVAFVIAGLTSIPAFVSGKAAAPLAAALPGVERAAIRVHHHASRQAFVATLAVAAIALFALFARERAAAWAGRARSLALALGLGAAVLSVRAANRGGDIRHPELRAEAPQGSPSDGAGTQGGQP
jgi:hypothetical protein